MPCEITEEQLFSWIDRDAPELQSHLDSCPICRERAREITQTIGKVATSVAAPIVRIPERIGDYQIYRLIGSGGQGWVFEAQQPSPKRRVALKVVKSSCIIDERDARRIRREADTLALLRHPQIASVYQSGTTDDGQAFFAMELVDGVSILDYAKENNLSLDDRLELFLKVCDALEYAHQQGVIHRDLKPSNILVEAGAQPKILDFGLARISDTNGQMTATVVEPGKIVGTLAYMSPEHARGDSQAIGIPSDVYSLCVILYELLVERPPYSTSSRMPHEALRTICEQAPSRPGSQDRRLRGDIETILLKGLEKDPTRRYQRVSELADDLRRYRRHEPISARRPSRLYKLRKVISRNKTTAALIGVIVALSTGFGAWITVIFSEAREARERALAPTSEVEAALMRLELAGRNWEDARRAKTDEARVKELNKVEAHCISALEGFKGRMPNESKSVLDTRILLGRVLTARGKAREAEPILRKAMQDYAAYYPGQSGLIAEAKSALGECLIRPGSFQQAEILLAESYPVIRAYRGANHNRTIEARDALAALYTAWGKPDKAREYGATANPQRLPASQPTAPSRTGASTTRKADRP
ncbi:MAG: serine/threonine protein kinase [Planctomycetes bacterium]|nr:serine/threonine protein kinase [Planctomycetota bacterium]